MIVTKSQPAAELTGEDLALLAPDPSADELDAFETPPEQQGAEDDDPPLYLTLSDLVAEPDPEPAVRTARKEIQRGPDNRIVSVTTYRDDGSVTVQQLRRDQNHRVVVVDETETRRAD